MENTWMKKAVLGIALCLVLLIGGGYYVYSQLSTTKDDSIQEQSNTTRIDLTNKAVSGKGASFQKNTLTITSGGTYQLSGTLSGNVVVSSDTDVYLELSDAKISSEDTAAISSEKTGNLYILSTEGSANLVEDKILNIGESSGRAAIEVKTNLYFDGEGSIAIYGKINHGVKAKGDISIDGGIVYVEGATDAIHTDTLFTMNSGNLELKAESDGVDSEQSIVINGGSIQINALDDGLHADGTMDIYDGSITIANSYEGLEADILTIHDGTFNIKADDDALNSQTNMIINGGTFIIDCEGDGYDSNGDMTINGGTHTIYSGNNANGALDIGDFNANYIINGGDVVALGGPMGISVSEQSSQLSIWASGSFKQASKVTIVQDDVVIESITIEKSESLLYYSSSKLKQNSTIKVLIDEVSVGEQILASPSTSINQVQGGMSGVREGGGPMQGGNRPEGMEGNRPK